MDTSALPIIICGHTVSVWHQFELVQRRRIFTTFAKRLGSQARPRFHEGAAFSKASLRRSACSALSPITCASAVSINSRG
jgi:hypothetical protein